MTRLSPVPGRIARRAAPVLASLLVAGCAGGMNALDELDETLRNFHHHLVAQATDHAMAYVGDEGLEAFEGLHDPTKNVNRLEEYTVVQVRQLPAGKDDTRQRATVVVKGSLRKSDSITVQHVRFTETWERIGGKWVLTDTRMARVEGAGGRD